MPFYADLHIHSKYSRACSHDCDLEHLAWWARRKGVTVVGSGDFTHPAWFEHLREDLEPAERFNRRLGRIGNIASDGRPILGLDSRDLLEITLESGPGSYLVPAHAWTPSTTATWTWPTTSSRWRRGCPRTRR